MAYAWVFLIVSVSVVIGSVQAIWLEMHSGRGEFVASRQAYIRALMLTVITLLSAGCFRYLQVRLVHRPQLVGWSALLTTALIATICVLSSISVTLGHAWISHEPTFIAIAAMCCQSSLVLVMFSDRVSHVIAHVTAYISHLSGCKAKLLRLHRQRAVITSCLSAVLVSIAIGTALQEPQIVELDITLHRLPRHMDGFRIVQLSDIHIGASVGESRVRRVVDAALTLRPDVVFLTGDIIDGWNDALEPAAKHLSRLGPGSSVGVAYSVTGNHEYIGNVEGAIKALRRQNIRVLRNERLPIYFDVGGGGNRKSKNVSESVAAASARTMGAADVEVQMIREREKQMEDEIKAFNAGGRINSNAKDKEREKINKKNRANGSSVFSSMNGAAGTTYNPNTYTTTTSACESGVAFEVGGVDDLQATLMGALGHGPNVTNALIGRGEDSPSNLHLPPLVMLAHQPKLALTALEHGVDLVLSGHTHAGQLFPFHFGVYLFNPFFAGHYHHAKHGGQVYVSSGTLFFGAPMRLLSRHEITVITLRAGEGGVKCG